MRTYDRLGEVMLLLVMVPVLVVMAVFIVWFSWVKFGPGGLTIDVLVFAYPVHALLLRRRRRLPSDRTRASS